MGLLLGRLACELHTREAGNALKPGETDAESTETMMHRQQQRMQAVLRDRFGMKLRMETRELPIYALTIAKRRSQLKDPETAGKGELTVSGRICGC